MAWNEIPVENNTGRVIVDCGIGEENMENRRTEKALRASEGDFEGIFANAPVGIFQSTADRLVVANPALASMFGYESPADMLARASSPARFFVQPDQRRQIVQAAVVSKGYVGREVQGRRKNGSIFTAYLRMRVVRDEAGEIKCLEGFVEDVTERKQAEEEMRILSQALEQSPATIVITDPSGTIEYVNPKFTQITGYSKEEAVGKNPRILKSGKKTPQDYKQMWDTLNSGKEWRGELTNKGKDGRLFWEAAVISPIVNQAGQITHFLAAKEDITQRKHLEEQLREAQKMEVVGQLASGVAHDFNNILAATLMHLGLLQDLPELTADMKESLREVEKETVRAANLTRQLLVFSRRQVAKIEPLDLNERIVDLLKMLRRILGENVVVVFENSSEGARVNADAGMMEQVVMNLCINARDAMPQGGRLTLATTKVEIPIQPPNPNPDARSGRFVCLSVTDTGCGMDEQVLRRIFEPFFTTKEVGKGTGLGLATVYGIVKQHDGWVEVKSIVGQGSSFRVYLPAGSAPRNAPAIPSGADEIAGGSETILLVEDEAVLRRLVAVWLRKLGYVVLEAGSGLEALEAWEQHHQRIALLFTDTLLPGNMTGLDLAARFRKEKASLKVISSSGYSADLAASPLAAGQEITFLPKPYMVAALAKIVRRCLDST
jgi:PAS domain S-box-containing protein